MNDRLAGEKETSTKCCLIADRREHIPEFSDNLIQVCTQSGFRVEVATTIENLQERISNSREAFVIMFLELEMLRAATDKLSEQLKSYFSEVSFPVVGLGLIENDREEFERRFSVHNYLLKYQQPGQILQLIRALTFTNAVPPLRKFPRFLANLEASFIVGNETIVGEVVDLSISGMFLKSAVTLPQGSKVRIEFRLEDGAGPISCLCAVRHSRMMSLGQASLEVSGMGIEFERLPDQDLERIQKYLTRRTPLITGGQRRLGD